MQIHRQIAVGKSQKIGFLWNGEGTMATSEMSKERMRDGAVEKERGKIGEGKVRIHRFLDQIE